MEPGIPDAPAPWTPPEWLARHQLPDSRFARAYDALGDQGRALIKRVIALQFALDPPSAAPESLEVRRYDLMRHAVREAPAPFVLLLVDAPHDAPAFFLSALLPALCARVPQVLVVRLGARAAVPDALLAACELAGQEQLAALGPKLLQGLLLEAAGSGRPGVVLHPDTPAFRRLLAQADLRAALDASPLRLTPLRLPLRPGLWRDAPVDLPPDAVSLLYGEVGLECGGAGPGKRAGKAGPGPEAFAAGRELLLVPDARAALEADGLCVCESCLGLWRWPQLSRTLFRTRREAFGPAS